MDSRGHPFDAIECAKEAVEYAQHEGLVAQEALALTTLVEARLANAEPSEALRAAKEAHDRAKRPLGLWAIGSWRRGEVGEPAVRSGGLELRGEGVPSHQGAVGGHSGGEELEKDL